MTAKFEEEQLRHMKAFNLRVRGLPKSQDPQKDSLDLFHDTLELQNITVQKAWFAHDDSLIICFHSATDRFQALRVKKKLFTLSTKIYLDADLTCIQVDELRKVRDLVAMAKKDNKWVVIQDCKVIIHYTPPSGWVHPKPSQ